MKKRPNLWVGAIAVLSLLTGVHGAEEAEAPGRQGRGMPMRQEMMQLRREIRAKEQNLLRTNPGLAAQVQEIEAQIKDLQEKRHNTLAEADPGLAELYTDADQMRDKAAQLMNRGEKRRQREERARGKRRGKGRAKQHPGDAPHPEDEMED